MVAVVEVEMDEGVCDRYFCVGLEGYPPGDVEGRGVARNADVNHRGKVGKITSEWWTVRPRYLTKSITHHLQ